MDRDHQAFCDQSTQFHERKTKTVEENLNFYIGKRIGHYKILGVLGEGGMGTVFLGEQKDPVQRQVALKVIRGGSSGSDFLARFHNERKAVASLDHPEIAKLLDVGTDSNGSPYFAMELIRGETLTDFCDQKKLTIRQRLTLFQRTCEAVAYAHSRGLVHRDLKPSNIMVEEADGEYRLKIIDFGLAKFIEGQKDDSILTAPGQITGTPWYMSPEQALGSETRLDIRSDIFSLGVILFELLTGSTPIKKDNSKRISQLLKEVAEFECVHPSSRISSSGKWNNKEEVSAISDKRSVQPGKLRNTIRGDLDWIVIKATDPDQDRRYRTCNDLSDDVKRYLSFEPVHARPHSIIYSTKKFVQKNRLTVTFLGLIGVMLIAMLGVGWYLALWALSEAESRQIATKNAIQAKQNVENALLTSEQEKRRATIAEKRAASSFNLITDSFESMNPSHTGRDLSAGDALWLAYQNSKHSMKDDLVGKANMLSALAKSLSGLGENQSALTVINEALRIYENESEDIIYEHLHARGILHDILLASKMHDEFRSEFDQSKVLVEVNQMENSYIWLKFRLQKAKLMLESYDQQIAREGAAIFLKLMPELNKSASRHRKEVLSFKATLASALFGFNEDFESTRVLKEVLEDQIKIYGHNHPAVILTRIWIARNKSLKSRLGEGMNELEESIKQLSNVYSENHPDLLLVQKAFAELCNYDFRHSTASELCQKLLPKFNKVFGANNDQTLNLKYNFAEALSSQSEFSDALKVAKSVVEAWKTKGKNHLSELDRAECLLANCFQGTGRHQNAIKLYKEIVDRIKDGKSGYNIIKDRSLLGLVQTYYSIRNYRQSIKYSKMLISYRTREIPPGEFGIAQANYSLGLSFIKSKKFGKAREQFAISGKGAKVNYDKTQRSLAGRIYAGSCYYQGKCFIVEGRQEAGIRCMEKAIFFQKRLIQSEKPVVREIDTQYLYDFLYDLEVVVAKNPTLECSLDFTQELKDLLQIQRKHLGHTSYQSLKTTERLTTLMIMAGESDSALHLLKEYDSIHESLIRQSDSGNETLKFHYRLLDIFNKEKIAYIYRAKRNKRATVAVLEKTLKAYKNSIETYSKKRSALINIHDVLKFSLQRQGVWFGKYRTDLKNLEKSLRNRIKNTSGRP